MIETKAKTWFRNDKKHVIEVTASDDSIAIDIYKSKGAAIRHYLRLLNHIIFKRQPKVQTKDDLATVIHGFIDIYYADDEDVADVLKDNILESLELKQKEEVNISYIG